MPRAFGARYNLQKEPIVQLHNEYSYFERVKGCSVLDGADWQQIRNFRNMKKLIVPGHRDEQV